MIILEVWCVGIRPEPDDRLLRPLNTRERDDDPSGECRRYVNSQLAGSDRELFERIDLLFPFVVPDWESSVQMRLDAKRRNGEGRSEEEYRHFLGLYERLALLGQ